MGVRAGQCRRSTWEHMVGVKKMGEWRHGL